MKQRLIFLHPDARGQNMTFAQSQLQTLVRWAYMVGKGFVADKCLLWASALAFTTALSLVPLLAVAFSMAKGFGFQNSQFIHDLLMQVAAGRAQTVDAIVGYINNTNVRTLGVVGVGFLFVTVLSLLSNIEKSFNSIWGVKATRGTWRKLSDYLFITLICPLLIIIAISATASMQNSAVVQTLLSYSVASVAYLALLKMLPYFSTWIALLFIYSFMPNTRVKFRSGIAGAVVAGTLWQFVQWGYIHYQASFKNYNAIYGSFAQVPLFLIWLFISWVIVLLGAEICFAVQNSGTYFRESRLGNYSHDDRQKLAALVLALLTNAFMGGTKPVPNEDVAHRLDAPVKLVNDVLHMLEGAGIVVKLDHPELDMYGLARPPDSVRMVDVIVALSRYKGNARSEALTGRLEFLDPVFEGIIGAAADSADNLTLSEFASRCEGHVICQPEDKTHDQA
ncbi:YihY/virulence factor BrkB family protein [Desulfovibrio ferrophilus]|uniref:Ribonuclease BN n=1 Tax=Desulfovibrio ferrophilus TaxID=241368 RepID=A0A2Z6B3M5_9BACT|nr:YihY/virulence factor BrkB family protein [Desulfovibrio ferrophilus]BBD10063.1 ribonuclease BN [Desulfovibrio ferrophilus]